MIIVLVYKNDIGIKQNGTQGKNSSRSHVETVYQGDVSPV